MAYLRMSLLGQFDARANNAPITTFESNKVSALLAYLVTEASHPVRREALADLLWPDWPQRSASRNLSNALADLRRNIGDRDAHPPYLLISRDTLQINSHSDLKVDLWDFIRLTAGQPSTIENLKSALDLYRGPFLEGFSLPDSTPFEEWLAASREHYQQRALLALGSLAGLYEEQEEYEQSLVYARRQLELEPWSEKAHQQVMRLLALTGRRTAALAHFEQCRRTLKNELDIAPGEETLRLVDAIRNGKLEGLKTGKIAVPVADVTSMPASTSQAKHNLPIQLTRFFGREQEIEKVKNILAEDRLVTLTGSGGVGKTRLSLEVANGVLPDFADGVWLVELDSLADPELVPKQVAMALEVLEQPNVPMIDSVSNFLRKRQVLLVLDNCEHLLDGCSHLADALLHASPGVKILATSREPLGVQGEAVFQVPSLPFPELNQALSIESLDSYASVRLFHDRARLALRDFQLTPENAPALAQICQRLDGIPLALELVAARLNVLTVKQLAVYLDDAFRLLTGGSRLAVPRHQTLRATIDWSYNLLSDPERLLFRRLAVFAGGWTLEAAEAVCGGDGLNAENMLDLLASLVAKSMVIVDRQDEPRYRLLETMRQYAREELLNSGESTQLFNRHRDYFKAFIEAFVPKQWIKEWKPWRKKISVDIENVRQSLEWSFSRPEDAEQALRTVLSMDFYWGYWEGNEAFEWGKRGIALCDRYTDISPSLKVVFIRFSGNRLCFNDPREGKAYVLKSIEISRSLGSEWKEELLKGLLPLVNIDLILGDCQSAQASLGEAQALCTALGFEKDPHYTHELAFLSANLAFYQGHFQDVVRYAQQAIQIAQQIGHPDTIFDYATMGEGYTGLEEYGKARQCFQIALEQAEVFDDNRLGTILWDLGIVDLLEGKLDQAINHCKEGMQRAVMFSDYNITAWCLGLAARILAKKEEPILAATLSGAEHSLLDRQKRLSQEEAALDTILPGWQDREGHKAIEQAYDSGLRMAVEEAVEFALQRL